MNERIEKLIVEAFFDEATNGCGQKMYTLGEEKMQKLAELIVKECAKVAGDFEYARLHDSLVEDHILKHFGVEE